MIELVGIKTYKLKLPQTIKIYNVFYISLLKPCDRTHKSNILLLPSINVESEDKYKVKNILNSKNYDSKL